MGRSSSQQSQLENTDVLVLNAKEAGNIYGEERGAWKPF